MSARYHNKFILALLQAFVVVRAVILIINFALAMSEGLGPGPPLTSEI